MVPGMAETRLVAAWLALLGMPGAGEKTVQRLAARCGGPDRVLAADESQWLAAHLTGPQLTWLRQAAARRDLFCRQAQVAGARGIRFLLVGNPDYPSLLAATPDPPPLLSCLGALQPEDARAVAVIGTRTPCPQGAATAAFLARALGVSGVSVVSGLAAGIDAAAHGGTLAAGGRTLAVLGCGLEHCYPPQHTSLATAVRLSGALLSECPPDALPSRQALLARNRLQAGLARAVVVVQAREKGGSYVAAQRALLLSRPVFAVQWGRPEFRAGCERLAALGAVVGEAQDLVPRLLACAYDPAPPPQVPTLF